MSYLSLEQNEIKSLPGDIFKPLGALTQLRLDANIIAELDKNLLENISALKQISLADK